MVLCRRFDSYDVELNPKSGTPVVCLIFLMVFEALWFTFKQKSTDLLCKKPRTTSATQQKCMFSSKKSTNYCHRFRANFKKKNEQAIALICFACFSQGVPTCTFPSELFGITYHFENMGACDPEYLPSSLLLQMHENFSGSASTVC